MPTQPAWPHSKAPWHVVPEERGPAHRWVIADANGGGVASCDPVGPWITPQEADANASLIAAAPEMLAALREVVADLNGTSLFELSRATIEKISAAIAKAEGAAS